MKRNFSYFWMLIFLIFSFAAMKSEAQNDNWASLMQDPTANVYKAKQAFDNYYKHFDPTKEVEEDFGKKADEFEADFEPYSIFNRWFNFMAPRVYPTGERFPSAKLYYEYQRYLKSNPQTKASANWTFLGPTHPTGYTHNGNYKSPGGSGRVNAITVDPTNSNIIWVGTPAGGLWKSTDGGQNWTLISDQFTVMGVSAIVIDPDNTNIMYIGTGDRDAGDTHSVGVWKSTDGGQTWQPTSVSFSEHQNARCTKILMNPQNHNIMLASFNGVVYRTTDGFATKTAVLQDLIWDMEFNPSNPNIVYAAGTKFYKSTDGGQTWTQITSGIPSSHVQRMEIAVSPAEPNSVWLLVGRDRTYRFDFYGLYKSTNAGSSFSTVYDYHDGNLLGWDPDAAPASSGNKGGQSFYDLSLAVNPSNPNIIFVGGVNLYRSTNGGSSWTCSAYWLEGAGYSYAHADYHALTYVNSTTLYAGNDGGIFVSTDNGDSWTDICNNLGIAQVARIGVSATNPNLILAGMQDNGTNKFDGSTWRIIYGGDGCEAIVDPTDDNTLYASYVYGALYRSTDGGNSWTSIKATSSEQGAWITPYVMDPTDHNTLYAGYENVYKTTNAGYSWTRLGYAYGSGQIIELEVAPSDPNYIYYIKQYWDGSSLHYYVGMTNDGGNSWHNIGEGLPIDQAAPTSIAISADNPQKVWITFSGYVDGVKVYKTEDAGQTWTNYSDGLPNFPMNAIVYQKGSNDALYVGGDIGVYYRDNSMSSWANYSNGLPHTVVKELEIYYDEANPQNSRLRAAMYGRSVWETPLATTSTICYTPTNLSAEQITSSTAKLSWNPVSGAQSYDVRYKAVSASDWTVQNTTNAYLNVGGLSLNDTEYEFQVRTNCPDGNSSAYSDSYHFGYVPPTYCSSSGNNSSDEWINAFSLQDINNTSGNNNGYGDFTNLSTDLGRGSSYNFTIDPAWRDNIYSEGYAIWIDFNKDGDFDDPGEQVFSQSPTQNDPITGTITIPSDAPLGQTRLRVVLKYNAVPDPCGSYEYGETEDYTVNIIDAVDNQPPTAPTNLTASNVSNNSVDLSWNASSDNVGVVGYYVYKNGQRITNTTNTSITVSGLQANTTYDFYVTAYDAQNNESDGSNVVEVTTQPDPDSIPPSAPTNLAYSNVTQLSVDLSWEASSDNVGVEGYRIYKDDAYIASTSNTSYTVNGLSAGTTYQFYVKAYDAAGNLSDPSNTVTVTTQQPDVSYCESKGKNSSEEWIDRVVVGDLDHSSGNNGGYADFTNYVAKIYTNNPTDITIYPAWSGTVYSEGYAVWIDFNHDGDFDDPGEQVFSHDPTQDSPITGSFTVPNSVQTGQTRMRISLKYNGIPTPCETFDWGEVEDYTVDIQNGGDLTPPSAPSNLSASNITSTSVKLSWIASTDNVGVDGYKIYKDGSLLTNTTGTSYTVNGLSPSTTYQFYVVAYDAAGNTSDPSNTISVTTLEEEDTQAPTAPTNLTYSNVTATSVNLAWDASSDNKGVQDYLIFKDGSLEGTTANTYYTVSGLSPNTTYQFYVKARDAAGNVSDPSNTVNVTTSTSVSYCSSSGENASEEWIDRVVCGSIDNQSGSNGGYADFTNLSTSMPQGTNQTITVYPAWSGSVYNEAVAVWIDWNQDGDFNDNGELVFTSEPSTTSPVSGTFTVPASALTGTTRMRVSMKYNDIPDPCETFQYGEVEDYTVSVSATNDTQAPTAPSNLHADNITQTTVDLYWDASSDDVGVAKYNIYKNGSLLGYVQSTSAHITGLSAGTTYEFYVTALDAAGNESSASNTINVTTEAASTQYCSSKGNNATEEWIKRVVLGSIDNTSGQDGGYGDYTNLSTSLTRGNTYTLYVVPEWAGTVYKEAYAAWIDYNQDGDFDDINEQIFSHSATTDSYVYGSFTVPTSAALGSTRMRVSMEYNAIPAACGNFSYGEVEDYTVIISSSKDAVSSVATNKNINIYPNPATQTVNFVMDNTGDYVVYLYNSTGQIVKSLRVSSDIIRLNVSELASGIYNVRIVGNNAVYTGTFIKQ